VPPFACTMACTDTSSSNSTRDQRRQYSTPASASEPIVKPISEETDIGEPGQTINGPGADLCPHLAFASLSKHEATSKRTIEVFVAHRSFRVSEY
jgi:hypothetical protein